MNRSIEGVILAMADEDSLNQVPRLLTRMRVQTLVDAGYQDDEILDDLAEGQPLSLHVRRRYERAIVEVRGENAGLQLADAEPERSVDRPSDARPSAVPECTPENVKAERARRIAAGEPFGVRPLARVFLMDASTIRRRLGTLK